MEVNEVVGSVHVITIDEGKEALRGGHETGKLEVVRTQDCPASKHKANVDHGCTDQETDYIWSCSLHGQNENIVGFKEAKIA